MAGKHQVRREPRHRRRRRVEDLPVRHWLAAGAASAGMAASLWGLSLAVPDIAVASADEGASASAGNAGTSHAPRSVRSVHTAHRSNSAHPPLRSAKTEDSDGAAALDTAGGVGDVDDFDKSDGTDPLDQAEPTAGTADNRDSAEDSDDPETSTAGVANRTGDQSAYQVPASTGDPADTGSSDAPATPVGAAALPDPEPSSSDVEVLTPAQSAVVSLDGPSFGRQLVASQIAALMGTGRTLISVLPVAAPVKGWLYDSLAGTRRTLFNQAPWFSPTQITADGDLPIVGTVGAVDLEGDRIRYSIVTAPLSGTIVIADDGTFTYTPNSGFTGVDNFVVAATDLGTHINLLDPFRSASTRASLLVNQRAVTFIFNYTSGSQYWTADARSALQRAATNLMSQFVVTTPVVVTYDIIGENDFSSGNLASAHSPLIGSGAGFFPTVVQHKLLTGVDANGAAADGQINWNFAYPWAFGDFVSGLQYDFTTVAMHEFVHSLGFMSYAQPSTTGTQRSWTLYDSFLRTASGAALIGNDFRVVSGLAGSLTGAGGGVYFGGAGAVSAYGTLVPLYAPTTWAEGSSISHLDGTVFTGPDRQMMNPQVPSGPGERTLSAVERAIMADLGYTLAPIDVTSAFTLVGFVLLRRRRALN
ncbi:Ig-like domain-containing protein [Mycobacterium adipatum]|uniref:Ig-like domain-containing protein n=1 Tax=Mycobacterium adipatum TaxID=1682113 RepID=UPI0034E06AC9